METDAYEILITCRTCLLASKEETTFVHLDSCMIESLTYLDCLNFCANIAASMYDGLPIYICVNCKLELEISYEFVKKSKNANDILRENILNNLVEYESDEKQLDNDSPYFELINADLDEIKDGDLKNETITDELVITQSTTKSFVNELEWNSSPTAEYIVEETLSSETETKNENINLRWQCKICDRNLSSRARYETHMNKHLEINPFQCDLCSYSCKSKPSLKRHYLKHNESRTAEQLENQLNFIDDTRSNAIEAIDTLPNLQEENTQSTGGRNSSIEENASTSNQINVEIKAPNQLFFEIPSLQQSNEIRKDEMLEVTSFRCLICDFTCKFKWSIVRHYKGRHKKHPTNEMLLPHIEYVTKPAQVENKPQQESILTQNNTLNISKRNPSHLAQCPNCNFTARSRQLVTKHLQEQHSFSPDICKDPITSNPCQECKLKFRSKSLLEKHIKKMHPNGTQYTALVKCDICGKQCRQIKYSSHRRNHRNHLLKIKTITTSDDGKTFQCSFCSKRFPNQNKLNFHLKYSHSQSNEKTFKCNQCPSKFICQYYLTQHEKTVHIQRKLKCEICGHLFKLHSQLREHMKRHKERIYRCTFCEKTYSRQIEHKIHLLVHTGEKPFKCDMCSESFGLKSKLNNHVSSCHLNQITKCPYCEKEFTSGKNSQYYSHIYLHTGMPYKCEYCSSEHEKKKLMRRHMKSAHQINISEEDLKIMYHKNTGKFARKRLQPPQTKKAEQEVQDQLNSILFEIEDKLENFVSV